MVEEHGVHGLSKVIVAAEREAEVRDATTDMSTWQMGLDPGRGANEVGSVGVVLRHTCGNC